MNIQEWHQRGDLKEKLNRLLQTEELKTAIEVMKDLNRPHILETSSPDGKIDAVAHALVQATCLGYDKAIRDLQENLGRTKFDKVRFTQHPYEYIKEKIERLNPPPLIPERKK